MAWDGRKTQRLCEFKAILHTRNILIYLHSYFTDSWIKEIAKFDYDIVCAKRLDLKIR